MKLSDAEKLVADRIKKEKWELEPFEDFGMVIEELGEFVREMRRYKKGRERPDETTPPKEEIVEHMKEEFGDALFPMIKLAMYYGFTLEEAILAHEKKMKERY